jgi:hypothetical protein
MSSLEEVDGVELALEPMGFPPAQTYPRAPSDAGIPSTALIADDADTEYRRLKELRVIFCGEPKHMEPIGK